MDMPIVILSPPELAGKTGVQRVDDDTHAVTAVLLDDGTDVSDMGISYKAQDA